MDFELRIPEANDIPRLQEVIDHFPNKAELVGLFGIEDSQQILAQSSFSTLFQGPDGVCAFASFSMKGFESGLSTDRLHTADVVYRFSFVAADLLIQESFLRQSLEALFKSVGYCIDVIAN